MPYIQFEEAGESQSGKTKLWAVRNTSTSSHLGEVKWQKSWRRYVFHPTNGTLFDPVCLRDVANFIETRTKEHYDALRGR